MIKELLPIGDRHDSLAKQQWVLESNAEMGFDAESDDCYPFKISVERSKQHGNSFYVKRVEIELPRDKCDAWFEYATRLMRQNMAGLAMANGGGDMGKPID
jgi:hypothetical protein